MPKSRPLKNPAPVLTTRALPPTVAKLLEQNIRKVKPSLLAEVRIAYLALYENPTFNRYREGVEPDETVEGSMSDDQTCAAQMLRKKGAEMNLPLLAKAQLHDIGLKVRAVERGYNASTKQRAAAEVEPESEDA